MSSYAEIASKIPLPVSRVHKARDSMESLGQIRQSPTRRDHFKSLSLMEDSELISSEPTPSFDSLLEELGMGTIYLSEDASETAAIFSDDEAAAILNGDKTRILHRTKNQGTKILPSNSPVVIDHDDARNEIIELPGDLGDSTSNELPRRKPRDSKNSPDPTNGEWEVINRRNRQLLSIGGHTQRVPEARDLCLSTFNWRRVIFSHISFYIRSHSSRLILTMLPFEIPGNALYKLFFITSVTVLNGFIKLTILTIRHVIQAFPNAR